MLRLPVVLLCLVLALFVAACGEDDDSSGETAATPTPTEEPAPAGCEAAEAPDPKGEGDLPKPKEQLEAGQTYVATVSTNCGDFEITLDPKQAPKTGGSFKTLADEGFYDGTTFHRIVPGFVIQGGDPTASGTGGPGYKTVDTPSSDTTYTKGVVAMAKAADEPPGTAGSQFFVVTAEDAGLPPDYAVIGKVVEGLDVVEAIGKLGGPDEQPTETVAIESVKVETS
jgi:peptidyl-prolyl cis-trans isomerase B (cyclophilin B)